MARLIAGVAAMLAVTIPLGSLAAQQITAIRAGRFVDVERGEVRRDQLLIIRGRRIEAVRSGLDRGAAGARVFGLSRDTVRPGLVDCLTPLIGGAFTSDFLVPLLHSEAEVGLSGVRD